jgi:methyl-accepting chemotaxis protein
MMATGSRWNLRGGASGKQAAQTAFEMETAELQGQIAAFNRSLAVAEFTMEGSVLTANDNFLAIVGYTLDDIVGKHHSLFVDPTRRDSAEYRQFWEKLGRGEFDRGQYKSIGKGGKEAWLEASYSPILDATGKAVKVMEFAMDITAQKHKDQLNSALKNSLDAVTAKIMAADKDRNIIFVNKAALELLSNAQGEIRKSLPSFDANRLVGSSMDMFQQGPSQQRAKLGDAKKALDAEVELGRYTFGMTVNPLYDESGARFGTVMEWADQTELRQTERELQAVVAAVIDGDMRARIDLSDKAGFLAVLSQKINELIESFAGVVARVKGTAEEVARGVEEISQGNADLSQRTESQASSLEQTASSMEEMTSSVRQNADNSLQANQLAVAARDQADKGGAVVAKAVKAMSEINQSSKKIADIIGVIDEIAFQTNLLALNAAVEAARAGEQGRGFAVVASEVRNLAGRSATAAKEIKGLIRDSVQKVEEGSSLVAQSGQTLEQIVNAVKKVSDIIAEIAAGSQEQSTGIEQVNKAVMQLDQMTQQNAALVEEASAASQSMAEQSQALSDVMSRYQVAESRSMGTAPSRPRSSHSAPTVTGRAAIRNSG